MKLRVLAAGAAATALLCGLAMAQTIRTPAPQVQMQNPNLAVAPASAVDLAALQARVARLEAAHNTTRTELAQARLQLQATQTRLAALVDGVHRYALCEKQRTAQALGIPSPGCGPLWDNLNILSNTP
jgi:hypothetical protein